jgi:hypothetical protein
MSLIDKPKELLELINSSLKPKREEKKKFGEVFTPMELVNEMLDKLDECYKKEHKKSIFEEKDFKWFDPANGMGNFPVAIYMRLNESLKSQIPNDKERKKHIIENMLYMSELNKKNCLITKQIFNMNNEYKLNLYEGDSLKLDVKKEFDVDKFDVIVGNPPYQKNYENNNSRVGGSSLWSEFINYSFPLLKNNGLFMFINPCSWMTGGTNKQSGNILNGIFKANTLLYLNIEECSKYFNVGSTFSYYIIKKSKENISFNCICKYKSKIYKSLINQEQFRELNVIPKLFTNNTISIIHKVENKDENKFNFERNRELDSSSRKDRFKVNGKYEVKHKVVDIRKSDYLQESCMNKHKVIISMPGYIKAEYDYKSGCSDATLYFIQENKDNCLKIVNILNHPLYKFIINNYRELTGLNNHKNINRLSYNINLKDNEIYKYFNLTNEEIKFIEKNT